ncbi:MAG TPA: ABC transporter ATP-binding protein [Ktedonobacterales bacterium]|nr:ABC transporter ATP-binding protein [Ktedonobacterales bacterium]
MPGGAFDGDGDRVVDVRGVGKAYRQADGSRAAVLRDISLAIAPGAILGLLGPNGAGKTTLIKILAGLLRPDTGGGTVLGYDLLRHHAEVRARVSLVAPTADVGIDNNLTVRQNLAFWAPIYGLRGGRARARVDELLGKLGLVEKADFWPMHISAGQRQRLALARSLLAENRLIFLDEPTNKLDLEGVRSVRQLIAELNREHGVTIILTTHVMEEAEELCGEIALLRDGELIAHQPTAELTRSLRLTRPLTVTVRQNRSMAMGEPEMGEPETGARASFAAWEAALRSLPGVTEVAALAEVAPVTASSAQAHDTRFEIVVQTLDLRVTTPALLASVRAHGLTLVGMKAEPVTLTDVFMALTRRQHHDQQTPSVREGDAHGR